MTIRLPDRVVGGGSRHEEPLAMRDPLDLKPKEFELLVRKHVESLASTLKEFRAEHLETLHGHDGDYTIDVTARFEALGVNFLVVVECKRFKSKPIERELVQVLKAKKDSVGAHKAIMFTTSKYRAGAIGFAKTHGIALIRVQGNRFRHAVKARIQKFETDLINPSARSLDDFLLDDLIGQLQIGGPEREELKSQIWILQQLKMRLDYLQDLVTTGHCEQSEVEELRSEIAADVEKLNRLYRPTA
jgi:restriction system protein